MTEYLVKIFTETAANTAADPVVVNSYEELNNIIAQLVENDGPVYCPRITEKEKAVSIPQDRLTDNYREASVCIEEVRGAIAETGSLICTSENGSTVQAGLLPAHHIAMVSSRNIYHKLDDFFGAGSSPLPTNITLETGPSRTADIELTLTIGVHGPERLSIIVFNED
ncbi:LUD domain-containing protein [Desulfomonile tiedjei]|uniref:LUD domain-containing protein n=1 Tax=Desulfomonile tiedjei (strain ATCC 49306 / DSM 6799 / DCB-1) TaxID=706587 RepID=I4C6V9_DESTA|nr:LUD domain-containing protein [Desulfomonile tiedjei]AFM25300.1 hypothetical protein Desti_2620 [Desulfomonile tiedjei DSM 6799]